MRCKVVHDMMDQRLSIPTLTLMTSALILASCTLLSLVYGLGFLP